MKNPIEKIEEVNIHSYFAESYRTDYEAYSEEVEEALKDLIETEIANYRYSDVDIIGRKGVNLFQPYIEKTIKKNNSQGVYIVRLYSRSKQHLIKQIHPIEESKNRSLQVFKGLMKRLFGKHILLTDAIRQGNDTNIAIDLVRPEKIFKVCGYLANKNGLAQLQKKYPDIKFRFKKIVGDEDYTKEQDRLQLIYQKRLFPIDGDHPFKIYSIKNYIAKEDLVNCIGQAANGYKLPENSAIINDKLIVPNIYSYTINLDPTVFAQKDGIPLGDYFDIERLQIRIKFDPAMSQLRVMALALIHTKLDPITNEPLFEYEKCPFPSPGFYRFCENTTPPKKLREKPTEKICPLCIDTNVSKSILKIYLRDLVRILDEKGIKIESRDL